MVVRLEMMLFKDGLYRIGDLLYFEVKSGVHGT
jgi:hypothetical protein